MPQCCVARWAFQYEVEAGEVELLLKAEIWWEATQTGLMTLGKTIAGSV
jgi:hypothetical protein